MHFIVLWILVSLLNSNFDLRGKVAVITGGNGGIGLGCAQGLANAGADIAIWARDEEKSKAALTQLIALGIKAEHFSVDVTNRSDIDRAVQDTVAHFGGIDILIANAGINIRKRPEDFSRDELQQVIDINITAVFECAQAVYPQMKARKGGKIILIGSLTSLMGFGISPIYAATKGAIVQLGKSLAGAWGGDNIQVNTILPGWVITDMTKQTRSIPGLREQVLARTPAGRWGEPKDFAGIATFLASSASDFITGTAIAVDGGFSSTLFIFDLPAED